MHQVERGRYALVVRLQETSRKSTMANISAQMVKELRERTGAGMMDCKSALEETGGDLDAAAELMRKQGLAKADKKAARVAAEGVVAMARAGARVRALRGRCRH